MESKTIYEAYMSDEVQHGIKAWHERLWPAFCKGGIDAFDAIDSLLLNLEWPDTGKETKLVVSLARIGWDMVMMTAEDEMEQRYRAIEGVEACANCGKPAAKESLMPNMICARCTGEMNKEAEKESRRAVQESPARV